MTQKTGKPKKTRPPPTPPQPKPWDVPPPAKGEATREAIFVAVGEALSQWEGLEGRLSLIFSMLVAPDGDPLAARRAYGSILTFRGRKEMIEAAAKAVFFVSPNVALQKSLKNLLNEVQGFAARRNEIAHGRVRQHTTKSRLIPMSHTGFVLGPPGYATNKTDLQPARTILGGPHHEPTFAYSSNEINIFGQHFDRLEKEGQAMFTTLWQHQAQAKP